MKKIWISTLIVPFLIGGCKSAPVAAPAWHTDHLVPGEMTAQEREREDDLSVGGYWTIDLSRTVLPKGLDNIKASTISLNIETDYKYTLGTKENYRTGTWAVSGEDLTLTESTPGSKPVHLTQDPYDTLTLKAFIEGMPTPTYFVRKRSG